MRKRSVSLRRAMIMWNVDVETRNLISLQILRLQTISILPIYLLATLVKQ